MLRGVTSKISYGTQILVSGSVWGEPKLRQDLQPTKFVISDLDHLLGLNCSSSVSSSLRLSETEMTLEEAEMEDDG